MSITYDVCPVRYELFITTDNELFKVTVTLIRRINARLINVHGLEELHIDARSFTRPPFDDESIR